MAMPTSRRLRQHGMAAAVGAGRASLYPARTGPMKTFTRRTPGDAFGFDAVTLGDVDGDGASTSSSPRRGAASGASTRPRLHRLGAEEAGR